METKSNISDKYLPVMILDSVNEGDSLAEPFPALKQIKSSKMRGKPNREGAWCWQSKAALRRIRENLDGAQSIASTLSVYVALTEISSDASKTVFTTTHAWIAMFAGISTATVKRRLRELADFGLISIAVKKPAVRGPDTYKLLSLSDTSLAHHDLTLAQSSNKDTWAASEESNEETKKKNTEEGSGLKPARIKSTKLNQTDEEWLVSLAQAPAFEGIDIAREHAKALTYFAERNQTVSRKRFLNWLLRCDKPMRGTTTSNLDKRFVGAF